MKNTIIDERLLAAAELVRGRFIADVGTDHGFLPIYLALAGKIDGAVASDIKSAPLKKAETNIKANGLENVIKTELAAGLSGLEKYGFDDIVIAGMGGLNIIGILDGAPFVKERRTHLILQPMQHITELRTYLCENGYVIDKESLAVSDGKIYQIISASYAGGRVSLSEKELLLGAYTIAHKNDCAAYFNAFCDKYISVLKTKIRGLEKGGKNADAERRLLYETEKEKIMISED